MPEGEAMIWSMPSSRARSAFSTRVQFHPDRRPSRTRASWVIWVNRRLPAPWEAHHATHFGSDEIVLDGSDIPKLLPGSVSAPRLLFSRHLAVFREAHTSDGLHLGFMAGGIEIGMDFQNHTRLFANKSGVL